MAEPKALIAFTGPRVPKGTLSIVLSAEYERAAFLLNLGFVDMIVDRRDLCAELAATLALLLGLPNHALS